MGGARHTKLQELEIIMEELTSKQRAQLRGLANSIDTILIVGKDGIA